MARRMNSEPLERLHVVHKATTYYASTYLIVPDVSHWQHSVRYPALSAYVTFNLHWDWSHGCRRCSHITQLPRSCFRLKASQLCARISNQSVPKLPPRC